MRVGTLRIPCRDLAAAAAFYETGIGLEKLFGSADEGFVGFGLDNAQVLLEPEEPGEFECGRYLGFSLTVEDIERFHKSAAERGVSFTGPPEKQFWGGVMTHVEDVSGNTFSVVEDRGD